MDGYRKYADGRMDSLSFTLLNKMNTPADIKSLSEAQLLDLASEIRKFLIFSISETGGHLASNLGVVELTIALHYVFDVEDDRIVWDVGHQSYVHKLLTGRHSKFTTLRKLGGLSGFPKAAESPSDAFDTGHASTAISAALGMAAARDLSASKDNYNVIAVTGDGSMTGGLSYEALNNAGQLASKLIVILNDNGMSISKSVGALSQYLTGLRTKGSYLNVKKGVKGFLDKVPLIGEHLSVAVEKMKNALKYVLVKGGIFQNMGFNYIGILDGHDLPKLIKVLGQVKDMDGPVLIHVNTIKGKGYGRAETNPDSFHGVGSFNVITGLANTDKNKLVYSDVFGQTMTKLAAKSEKIVAITAAMPDGTGLIGFQRAYPSRFFDVGIAEGHGATFAAGLAKQGIIPVYAVYSTFLQRAYDQLIHDICLPNLHVVLAVDRAGIVGPDGETHQGLFDLSFLLHMPNMRVMCPKNRRELEEMLELAIDTPGPSAVRYPRGRPSAAFDFIENREGFDPVRLGKSEIIFEGKTGDTAIVALGAMTEYAYAAWEKLDKEGFRPTLINARFAKPIDKEMLAMLAGYKYIFTVEDNYAAGGFGAALLMELHSTIKPGEPIPYLEILAFPDKFIEHGTRSELLRLYGLDGAGIYKAVKSVRK